MHEARSTRPELGGIGFGGAAIGNLYTEVDDDIAEAAVRFAYEQGIRYFDTAPFYGYGLSEERLGNVLAGFPDKEVRISTKVGRRISDAGGDRPADDGFAVQGRCARFDYSRDGVLRSLESSLRRLRRQAVDTLLIHDVGRETHGDSMIVDPWGVVLDRLPRGSGVVVAGINPEYQQRMRKGLPALAHRTLHRC